eukprot:COSAG02_NODE_3277_length_7027_cov_19.864463_4_plen_138_part_00
MGVRVLCSPRVRFGSGEQKAALAKKKKRQKQQAARAKSAAAASGTRKDGGGKHGVAEEEEEDDRKLQDSLYHESFDEPAPEVVEEPEPEPVRTVVCCLLHPVCVLFVVREPAQRFQPPVAVRVCLGRSRRRRSPSRH